MVCKEQYCLEWIGSARCARNEPKAFLPYGSYGEADCMCAKHLGNFRLVTSMHRETTNLKRMRGRERCSANRGVEEPDRDLALHSISLGVGQLRVDVIVASGERVRGQWRHTREKLRVVPSNRWMGQLNITPHAADGRARHAACGGTRRAGPRRRLTRPQLMPALA